MRKNRELSRYEHSQWERSLQCNDVSHLQGAYLDWWYCKILPPPPSPPPPTSTNDTKTTNSIAAAVGERGPLVVTYTVLSRLTLCGHIHVSVLHFTTFLSQLNIRWNFVCCQFTVLFPQITTNMWTCHDGINAVPCATFCYNQHYYSLFIWLCLMKSDSSRFYSYSPE